MVGVPSAAGGWLAQYESLVRDAGSRELAHGGGYMFKDLPQTDGEADYLSFLIGEMDRWNIERALVPVAFGDEWGRAGLARYPGRLMGSYLVDPNGGGASCASLRRAVADLGSVAAACFPSGTDPQVSISDPQMYPLFAACAELQVPLFLNVGVPGPRFPLQTQHVEHLDQVCFDFPELTIVMRHGAEPWEELAIALMRKWPNLYYSTSAFAPRHYPRALIDYANADGAEKVAYAGYFPSGLSLERIMNELPGVPLRADVWPQFLRGNAERILGLG